MAKKIFNKWSNIPLTNKLLFIFILLEFMFITHFKVIFGVGASMTPSIKSHQILMCKYTDTYKINDIILYNVDGFPIVHRIVRINEHHLIDGKTIYTYKTKGDNNSSEDVFELYKENIICKIMGIK